MCVRPWIKAADVCPLTSTGPCLLHLWQAATARPLKCSLTTSSSSTIISSALVKAPPRLPQPCQASPRVISHCGCLLVFDAFACKFLRYLCGSSLFVRRGVTQIIRSCSMTVLDLVYESVGGRQKHEIFTACLLHVLIRGRACSVRSQHVHNQKLLPSGRLLHFHIQSL